MEVAPSSYCYRPLLPEPDGIRLLRLLPCVDESAPIQCQLFNYSLRESGKRTHPYDALSYVWGSWENPGSIFIDNHEKLVTRNLYGALSRLRHGFIERFLWIDALCINQADLSEKEQQIQFMAKIYAQANRVVVWLGEAADDSDQALEVIRVAGADKDFPSTSRNEVIQHAILALLRRSWFRRIWILQEVAAARHILIMCGHAEIDGYAFCLGVDSLKLYEADRDLHILIHSVTYLIRGAIFRPGYKASVGRSSLYICPLIELIDMYHTHEATQRHDKVYALLGMSSDDLSKARLSPSYRVSWDELFQDLVKFLLFPEVTVETLGHKQTALIKSKGCILGELSVLEDGAAWSGRQGKEVTFTSISEQPSFPKGWSTTWTPHNSANPIRNGDLVCMLQGASKPTIIRICEDHFDIVMIVASLPEEMLELSRSVKALPRDLILIWDWEKHAEGSQDERACGVLLREHYWASEYPKTALEVYFEKAKRLWNIATVFTIANDYSTAVAIMEEVAEHLEMADERKYSYIWKQQLEWFDIDAKDKFGRTLLSWAAENGNENVVKLLVEFGKANVNKRDSDDRTALLWAARNGNESIVQLLVESYNASVDAADVRGNTPLSYAAWGGYEGVASILIKTGKADPNCRSWTNETPLCLAAASGYEGIVKLLLETGKVNVDAENSEGRTALALATIFKHEGIVKLLIKAGSADTATQDAKIT